ncbi:MAG: hypothetical protein QMC74_10835 [Myxococcota bacterium]
MSGSTIVDSIFPEHLKRSNKQERDGYVESARHDGLDPQAVLILEAPVTTRV